MVSVLYRTLPLSAVVANLAAVYPFCMRGKGCHMLDVHYSDSDFHYSVRT